MLEMLCMDVEPVSDPTPAEQCSKSISAIRVRRVSLWPLHQTESVYTSIMRASEGLIVLQAVLIHEIVT